MAIASFMKSSDVLVMDFGNSRVKILHGNNVSSISYAELDYQYILDVFASCGSSALIYSSVNTAQSDAVLEVLRKNNISIYSIESFLRHQTIVDFSMVEGTGSDRQLGVLGALSFCKSPLITIDCGTMITVNVLNKNNVFLGGAILPGFSTLSRAVHDYAEALPLLTSVAPEQTIGNKTDEAIRNGIFSAGIGGVLFFLQRLENNSIIDTSYTVVVTGGDGSLLYEYIHPLIPYQTLFDADLVLKGIVSGINFYQ